MSMILDEHRQYLSDETRLGLFRKAIHKVVRPGDVVVDLGCGTGILGMLAWQAGAASCAFTNTFLNHNSIANAIHNGRALTM